MEWCSFCNLFIERPSYVEWDVEVCSVINASWQSNKIWQ